MFDRYTEENSRQSMCCCFFRKIKVSRKKHLYLPLQQMASKPWYNRHQAKSVLIAALMMPEYGISIAATAVAA